LDGELENNYFLYLFFISSFLASLYVVSACIFSALASENEDRIGVRRSDLPKALTDVNLTAVRVLLLEEGKLQMM
jgi:hypothetical protein